MPASAEQTGGELRTVLTRAHEEATRLLATPDSQPLDVVAWLSAHIAAFDHAVYPTVRRRLAKGGELIAADRVVVSKLARSLRIMERRHSGDVLASGLSSERLHARISDLVRTHQAVQSRIVEQLEEALDSEAVTKLARAYETALAHAPTRPHPHFARGGLMFRLDAMRDRLLDTMDGRHVPIPRLARRRIMPGRWGSYFLGQPHPESRDAG
jgi:hypothetical protein